MAIEMPLSTRGRFVVDARGQRVRLAGVNWYGAHEDDGVAPGLDRTDRRTLARRIALLGFNSVRLPFSLWMTQQAAPVPDEYLAANLDLSGATPLQVYDACVEALTDAGLIVVPNCHILDRGWCPVPETTQILTRSGWKYWHQVEDGDQTLGRASNSELQWTPILRVTSWGPQPVIRLGNARWSAVCTENHRWLMRSRRNRYVKGSGSKNMPRTGPRWNEPEPHPARDWATGEYQLQLTGYAEGGKNGCTPEQAAIIAWALADGSWIYIAPLWESFRVAQDPTAFVLGLSQEARRAWLDAWFAAEGWYASGGSTRIIAQDRGPVFDAIALSVFLEGYMPGIARNAKGSFAGSKGSSYNITLLTKTIGNTRNCTPVYEAMGTEPVWCPTTALGTFVARDREGKIFLTGNCSEDDGNGLWFSSRWPATKFFAAWQDMAARYQSNPLVAAMDIMNEPRRTRVGWRVLTPTWGSRPKTDLAAMYTTVGNLIHQISPHVLIICEGLGYAADLTGVARYPVRLEHPGKVVYSLHDYPWFHHGGQSRQAYFRQMHDNGGYILSQQIAPLWIGEFGNDTRSLDNFGRASSPQAAWWNNIEAWLTENDVDWCWWALNPTQPRGTVPVVGRHRSNWGDPETWGLLAPDWRGVANPQVLDILTSMIPPRTGPGVSPA